MIKNIIIGVVIWLLLTAWVLVFMAAAAMLNERYDRSTDDELFNDNE